MISAGYWIGSMWPDGENVSAWLVSNGFAHLNPIFKLDRQRSTEPAQTRKAGSKPNLNRLDRNTLPKCKGRQNSGFVNGISALLSLDTISQLAKVTACQVTYQHNFT